MRKEPEKDKFTRLLRDVSRACLSSGNLLESLIVLTGRHGNDTYPDLSAFLDGLQVEIVPVDRRQVRLAYEAFLRFGKGRHKAALNYGDCFAYALARQLDMPLLFKGDDFSQTDVRPAL